MDSKGDVLNWASLFWFPSTIY